LLLVLTPLMTPVNFGDYGCTRAQHLVADGPSICQNFLDKMVRSLIDDNWFHRWKIQPLAKAEVDCQR
jgi:hypothetical protein